MRKFLGRASIVRFLKILRVKVDASFVNFCALAICQADMNAIINCSAS